MTGKSNGNCNNHMAQVWYASGHWTHHVILFATTINLRNTYVYLKLTYGTEKVCIYITHNWPVMLFIVIQTSHGCFCTAKWKSPLGTKTYWFGMHCSWSMQMPQLPWCSIMQALSISHGPSPTPMCKLYCWAISQHRYDLFYIPTACSLALFYSRPLL